MHRTHVNALVIRGARVIDPAMDRDETADVAMEGGRIVSHAPSHSRVIDAQGWIVCPGLMDLHVHLREPGGEHKETIETGCSAASAGGFTFVACMPNTTPALDEPARITYVLERARQAVLCEVGPVAAITRGRRGTELTDMTALLEAGAVAFSDDGVGVESDSVMHAAFERAHELDALLIQHCEYRAISAGGVLHLGEVSRRLRLPGIDPRSEEAMIERDIDLCRKSGGRYHVAHISTAKAIEMVRRAKAEGLPVTAEVCPHHLVLTDEACSRLDPNTKMHPPLRPAADVEACRHGLLDGTIDAVASDHAPHAEWEKAVGFAAAPPGVIGLETALGITARAMVETRLADWPELLRWFTTGPAAVLRRRLAPLVPGNPTNLTIFDPKGRWIAQPMDFCSKSRNTPFAGWELMGRPMATLRAGVLAHLRALPGST